MAPSRVVKADLGGGRPLPRIVKLRPAFASSTAAAIRPCGPDPGRARAAALGSESTSSVSPVESALVITDPLFYLLAVPAVVALGLGKGGFAGIGMISTPLLALRIPPLQAAAILLPIVLVQDVISVWTYRRCWSAWNLKVLLPGSVVGVVTAWLFAAYGPNAYV